MTFFDTALSDKTLLIGTFLLTPALLIYAALSYHRPPVPRRSTEAGETARTRFGPHIPTKTLVSGVLGVLFAGLMIYLVFNLRIGPLDSRVEAMARLSWLEHRHTQFRDHVANIIPYVTTYLSDYETWNLDMSPNPCLPFVKS